MDKVEKMDYRAKGEVIFWCNEHSTVLKSKNIRFDQSWDKVEREKKGGTLFNRSNQEQRIVLTGIEEK
jgi:hypothetical protein